MANNKIKTKRSNHRLQKMRYSTCTLITESFIYIRLRISHVMFKCIFEYWIKSVSPNSHCTGALALDYPMNDKSTLVIFCLLFLARLFQWLIVLKDAKICKSSYNKAFFLVEFALGRYNFKQLFTFLEVSWLCGGRKHSASCLAKAMGCLTHYCN